MRKISSVEDYKHSTSFQALRKTLLQEQFAADLEKSLVYWAVPGDRRLPLAFLGRTLNDLLQTPFEELAATPGIGQKKIGSLLKLLSRATKKKASPDWPSISDPAAVKKPSAGKCTRGHGEFDPNIVSEGLWEQWCETVRQHGVESEQLGRLAPTLQSLPTVIWRKPLSEYLDYSVVELRQLKTYGEKRVRIILEIFHAVHELLSGVPLASHLTLRLQPKFTIPLERWIAACLNGSTETPREGIRQQLAMRLVAQVQVDCGPEIARLAEGRLGLHGAPQSVRTQAKRMNLTRARVYQLLEECQRAIAVRWSEGRGLLNSLRQKWESVKPPPEGLALLHGVIDLFFPEDTDLARGAGKKT